MAQRFSSSEQARRKTHGYFGEYVKQDSEDGEIDANAFAAKTLFQIFGHRVDAGGDVDRHEEPAENDQYENRLNRVDRSSYCCIP